MKHNCPTCGENVIKARKDKIYCSDSCRVIACQKRRKGVNTGSSQPIQEPTAPEPEKEQPKTALDTILLAGIKLRKPSFFPRSKP